MPNVTISSFMEPRYHKLSLTSILDIKLANDSQILSNLGQIFRNCRRINNFLINEMQLLTQRGS